MGGHGETSGANVQPVVRGADTPENTGFVFRLHALYYFLRVLAFCFVSVLVSHQAREVMVL